MNRFLRNQQSSRHELRGSVPKRHIVEVPMPSLDNQLNIARREARLEKLVSSIDTFKQRANNTFTGIGRIAYDGLYSARITNTDPIDDPVRQNKFGKRIAVASIATVAFLGLAVSTAENSEGIESNCVEVNLDQFEDGTTPAQAATLLTNLEAIHNDNRGSGIYDSYLGSIENDQATVCNDAADALQEFLDN